MNATILRSLSSISSKNTALPHESACCVESLLPSKPQQQVPDMRSLTPPAAIPASKTLSLSLTASTKLLLKQLVFKAMNANKATTSISKPASTTMKVAPASPVKVPSQLPSFPSNITVDTMCSEEEDEQEEKREGEARYQEPEEQEQEQQQMHYVGGEEVEDEHSHDLAATRAFAYLEQLSQPKQPMSVPLKKVRGASNRWHRSLLHTEEEVETLLPLRVLV